MDSDVGLVQELETAKVKHLSELIWPSSGESLCLSLPSFLFHSSPLQLLLALACPCLPADGERGFGQKSGGGQQMSEPPTATAMQLNLATRSA